MSEHGDPRDCTGLAATMPASGVRQTSRRLNMPQHVKEGQSKGTAQRAGHKDLKNSRKGQRSMKGKEIISEIIQGEFSELRGMSLWIGRAKARNVIVTF